VSAEYDFEPIPGLPANLPEGEQLLWQGSPAAVATARRVLHIGLVAVYFGLLLTWRLVAGLSDGHSLAEIAVNSVPLLVLSATALAIIGGLAYLIARTTIYTITSQRVVMRYGVALPMAVDIPFKTIKNANVSLRPDGTGDIALEVEKLGRLTYFHLWPNTRAWYLRQPQPTLRALPDAAGAAALLSKALNAAAGTPEKATRPAVAARPAQAVSTSGASAPAAA
jgi:hypothetical protein